LLKAPIHEPPLHYDTINMWCSY